MSQPKPDRKRFYYMAEFVFRSVRKIVHVDVDWLLNGPRFFDIRPVEYAFIEEWRENLRAEFNES